MPDELTKGQYREALVIAVARERAQPRSRYARRHRTAEVLPEQ